MRPKVSLLVGRSVNWLDGPSVGRWIFRNFINRQGTYSTTPNAPIRALVKNTWLCVVPFIYDVLECDDEGGHQLVLGHALLNLNEGEIK